MEPPAPQQCWRLTFSALLEAGSGAPAVSKLRACDLHRFERVGIAGLAIHAPSQVEENMTIGRYFISNDNQIAPIHH